MKKTLKSNESNDSKPQDSDYEMLDVLQRRKFTYFLKEVNDKTGLMADKTQPGSPQVLQQQAWVLAVM